MVRRKRKLPDLHQAELVRPGLTAHQVETMERILQETRGLCRDFAGEFLPRIRPQQDESPGPRVRTAPARWPLRQVQIEVVNRCNYRCPLCRTLAKDGVTRRRMTVDEFRRVLGPVAESLENVVLYGTRGEPFLHPGLEEMIAWSKDVAGARVELSTNGSLVTPDRADDLLASRPDVVIFAVDGLTEETYRRYRVGGELATVRENLRHLCGRRDAGGHVTRVILQVIPMAINEAELSGLPEFGRELGVDEVRIKVSSSVTRSRELRPVDPAYLPAPEPSEVFCCPFGLEKLYVDPSGDCFPCCYTEGFPRMRIGNALERSLAEIWDDDACWELRRSFLEQSRFNPFCLRSCEGKPRKRRHVVHTRVRV